MKNSKLCCCVSQYFCTSSTSLEKCQQGCCGKCISDSTENDSSFDSESETNSEVEIESNGESSSRSDTDPEPDVFSYLSS